MWKRPNRPANEITQTYNDGIIKIYSVADSAQPGYAPVRTRTLAYTLPYAERRVGVQRRYLAAQNQAEIDRVLRVPAVCITTQDEANIGSVQYRIDTVQTVADVYPPSLDLTLVRVSGSGGEAL